MNRKKDFGDTRTCSDCNAALGMLKDNPVLIKNLLKYIENALSKNIKL